MRKTREEKAITLIALIITIVVLLILAVVAINAVTGDGIIQHAKNAKTEYEKGQAEEEEILSYYGDYLDVKGNYGPWKENGDNILMKDKEGNEVKIALGSEVTYVPVVGKTYTSPGSVTGIEEDQVFTVEKDEQTQKAKDISWTVIGVEYGKVVLLSNNLIAPTGQSEYIFTGLNVPTKAEEELNRICSIYKDDKIVDVARSVNERDILSLCQVAEEDKKSMNEYYKYNNQYTYKYGDSNNDGVDDTIMLKRDNGEYAHMARQEVLFPDGTKVDSNNKGPKSVVSKYYNIDLDSRRCGSVITGKGNYWLATTCVWVYDKEYNSMVGGDFNSYLKFVCKDVAAPYDLAGSCIFKSRTGGYNVVTAANAKVRPVVVLKTNIQLEDRDNDKTYEIYYE